MFKNVFFGMMACYEGFGVLYDGMGILGSCASCFASLYASLFMYMLVSALTFLIVML